MSFRYRDDDSSTGASIATVLIGAVAGFAVGMFVAQRVGGFGAITNRLRGLAGQIDESRRGTGLSTAHGDLDQLEDEIEDETEDFDTESISAEGGTADDGAPLLEERVLEAFNNDPILAERAVDIGAMGTGIIELAGWVESDEEAEHAMTLARGVPGVDTVVNRLMIDDEEREIGDTLRRREAGDPALSDAGWEGQQVGTGKRRQGASTEVDRHADPKPVLEDRWLSEREAIRNSAEELDEISAERRKRGTKARGGAPKGDIAEPTA